MHHHISAIAVAAVGESQTIDSTAMAPVTFQMNVHCKGCGKKIRKFIQKMDGVDWVEVKRDTGRVIVTGNPDASAIRARLESEFRTTVTIVDGGRAESSRRGAAPESESEEEDVLGSLQGPPPVPDPTWAFQQAYQPPGYGYGGASTSANPGYGYEGASSSANPGYYQRNPDEEDSSCTIQ